MIKIASVLDSLLTFLFSILPYSYTSTCIYVSTYKGIGAEQSNGQSINFFKSSSISTF